MSPRPHLTIVAADATPDETAAAIAAIEQFRRDTVTDEASGQRAAGPFVSPWKTAALLEGVTRQPERFRSLSRLRPYAT